MAHFLAETWWRLLQLPPQQLKPGHLEELVRKMGALADWWLAPELVRRLQEELQVPINPHPSLPGAAGTCYVLFAQNSPPRWPALRPAFVLPLQWRRDEPHSPHLPHKLRDLAERVANAISKSNWGLHLSSEAGLDGINLSDFDEHFQVGSGWAALAGGLMVAAEGGQPDPLVWATGAWGQMGGLQPVCYLEAKIQSAAEYGARQLFVPKSQEQDAQEIISRLSTGLEIGTLQEGTPDPKLALSAYRDALDLPPLREDTREKRKAWYLRQQNTARATEYYRMHLLPDIIEDLQRQWDRESDGSATHLVTIISDNPELACLAVAVVRPQQALMLYSKDKHSAFEQAKQLLDSAPLLPHVAQCRRQFQQCCSLEDLVQKLPGLVRDFTVQADPNKVLLDVTPGTKEMSLILALEIASRGNRLYYVRHERQGSRVVPFSERLKIFHRN